MIERVQIRLVCLLLASAAVVALLAGEVGPPQVTREEDLKAALLVNFIRFAEWPPADPPDTPFVIGVYNQPELVGAIYRYTNGKSAHGRPIQVRGIKYPTDAKLCHLIFLGGLDGKALEEMLSTLPEHGILSVGESQRFIRRGGVIQMFQLDGHLSFQVSLKALSHTGLSISSKLLRLGYVAKEGAGTR